MGENDVLKSLKGNIWEMIFETKPEDLVEPSFPVGQMETPLGDMGEVEKILFTIQEELFAGLLIIFGIHELSEEEIDQFDTWLFDTPKEGFIARCKEEGHDATTVAELRNQFFAAHDLLEIVTSQHFAFDPEDFQIYYRKDFKVSVQRLNLFDTNEN